MKHSDQPVEILLVEDALFFRSIIKSQAEKQLGFKVTCATNFQEAVEILEDRADDFFLALLDLNLPDAPNGEIVDYVVSKNVPALVFSGNFDEELREQLMRQRVIDYVVKESPASIEYVISSVRRLYNNQFIKVLVVDDSKTARYQMVGLLERYKFQVLEACDGLEALKVLDENPDIMMVILDYNMPNLDGFQLTKKIRTHRSRNDLCIIGASTFGNNMLSAKFIKIGANDFITKPFLNEEFFCRISQNIEMLEHIRALKDSAVQDYLTGLYNRTAFFERATERFEKCIEDGDMTVAIVADIDDFKSVNATHGHHVGDEVLKQVATLLRHHFVQDALVSRLDGAQFAVFWADDVGADIKCRLDDLRQKISVNEVRYGDQVLQITISIGACQKRVSDFSDLLDGAFESLKQAKEKGRDCVILQT